MMPPKYPNSLDNTGYQKNVPFVPQIIKFKTAILKDPSLIGPNNLSLNVFSYIGS